MAVAFMLLASSAHAEGYNIDAGVNQPPVGYRPLPSLEPITTPQGALPINNGYSNDVGRKTKPLYSARGPAALSGPSNYSASLPAPPPADITASPASSPPPFASARAQVSPDTTAAIAPASGTPINTAPMAAAASAPIPVYAAPQQGVIAPLPPPPLMSRTQAASAAAMQAPVVAPAQPVILSAPVQTAAAAAPAEVAAPPAVMGSSALPIVPPANASALSPESRKILDGIHPPSDLPVKPAKASKVDMKRVNPQVKDIVKRAEQSYESAGVSIKVHQPSLDVADQLQQAYDALAGGDDEVAIRIYQDILKNDPRNEDAMFGLAATYHRTGQIDNARALYGRLLQQDPGHKEALNNFLMLVSNESPQDALNELANLEQRYPSFSPIPAQMGVLFDRLGQPELARSKMLRAIELSPENMVYKYNLAIMLDRQGQYSDAADIYRSLIAASLSGEKLPFSTDSIQSRLNYIAPKAG